MNKFKLLITFFALFSCVNATLGITSAANSHGFSGNYGLGGGFGGMTLSRMGYGLGLAFAEACFKSGLQFGLPFTPSDAQLIPHSQYAPQVGLSSGQLLNSPHLVSNPEYASEILLSSGTNAGSHYDPGSQLTVNLGYGPAKDLTPAIGIFGAHIPQVLPDSGTNTLITHNGIITGYTSSVNHKGGGHSYVYFNKLITTPPKILPVPLLEKRSITDSAIINDYREFPFTSVYPSALSNFHDLALTGGYASVLTGSYGSVLTGGYNGYNKRVGLLPDGGLKGLSLLNTKSISPIAPIPPITQIAEPATPIAPITQIAEPYTPIAPITQIAEPYTSIAPISQVAEPSTPLAPITQIAEPSWSTNNGAQIINEYPSPNLSPFTGGYASVLTGSYGPVLNGEYNSAIGLLPEERFEQLSILRKRSIPEISNINNIEWPHISQYTKTIKNVGSGLNGGYGSALTGSYGSVLTGKYIKRIGLLSEGKLKELSILSKRSIKEPSIVTLNNQSPLISQYSTALKNPYGSGLTRGFGSMLTGSYGSFLTGGYNKRLGLVIEEGLK